MMSAPGAAAPTHGPCIEKSLGAESGPKLPTVSTSGSYHAGVTMVRTSFQPRGSSGTDGSGGGFWVQSCPVLPAATTITTFLTLTAKLTAAPSVDSSTGLVTLMQAASLTLMTPAPRLAACTIARARLRTDPAVWVLLGSLGSTRAPTG